MLAKFRWTFFLDKPSAVIPLSLSNRGTGAMPKSDKVTIHVQVDRSDWRFFRAMALEAGVTAAAGLRNVIREYLNLSPVIPPEKLARPAETLEERDAAEGRG